MQENPKRIFLNFILAGAFAFTYALLFYNWVENRFLGENFSKILGLSILLLILAQIILIFTYLLKSLKAKQYIGSIIYLFLAIGLFFIGKMGLWVTMIYLGAGAVGDQ